VVYYFDKHLPPFSDHEIPHSGYAFLMNVNSIVGAKIFEIFPGVVLRRATPQEIKEIKPNVKKLHPFSHMNFWEQPAPYRAGPPVHLPRSKWRYYVLSFQDSFSYFKRILSILELADLELEVGLEVLHVPRSKATIVHSAKIFHFLECDAKQELFAVTPDGIGDLQSLSEKIEKHDNSAINMDGIIKALRDIKLLPYYSQMRALAYFAVLESLITHDPNNQIPPHSITHQVKTKMILLNKRFPRPMNYSVFGKVSEEKIWTMLYSYRSALAHGDTPDFKHKMKILKDSKSSLQFIKEAVKSVARQALIEPHLIANLKEC